MKIALEKSCKAGLVGRLTDWFSGGGGFCHCILLLGERDGLSSYPEGGVSVISFPDSDRPKYEIFDIGHVEDEPLVRGWAMGEVGMGYDYAADIWFIRPFRWFVKPDPKRWMCSELTVAACQVAHLFGDLIPAQTSPNTLVRYLRRKGYCPET